MGFQTAKDIIVTFDQVESMRLNFESEWQQISDEGLGRRDFTTQRSPGRQRTARILDTTMRQSQTMLVGGLQGLLANPDTVWFDMRPEDERLLDNPEVVSWFEDTTRITLRSFQRPSARWATMFSELLYDNTGFGTGALMTLEDPVDGVYFIARPLNEIYLREDERGQIDTIFRKFPYTARQVALAFGDKNNVTPSKEINDTLAQKPEKTFEIIQMVHKTTDPSGAIKPDIFGRPWRSVYVTRTKPVILQEGGFHENPIHITRWQKEAGEVYGRGPGWISLPDAKTLNKMTESLLKMGQKAVEPPLLVPDDGVLTQLRSAPNSLNVVRADMLIRSRGNLIQPLPTGSNFPVTRELLQDRQQGIREAFFATLLQLFRDPRMTATQVLELSAEAQRLMAPMLSRVKSELLDPVVFRTFMINWRRGAYRQPPEVLRGVPIRLEYTSPVLRSQRQPEAQAVLQTWASAGQIGQVDPTVYDNLSSDNSIRIIHDALGAPASVLRSPEAVEALREAQARAAQQQAQLAQAEQLAEIASKAGPGALAGAGASVGTAPAIAA